MNCYRCDHSEESHPHRRGSFDGRRGRCQECNCVEFRVNPMPAPVDISIVREQAIEGTVYAVKIEQDGEAVNLPPFVLLANARVALRALVQRYEADGNQVTFNPLPA